MSTEQTEDIDLLIAARKAWEVLHSEMLTHDLQGDFLCLVCYKRAKEFDAAVGRLEARLAEVGTGQT